MSKQINLKIKAIPFGINPISSGKGESQTVIGIFYLKYIGESNIQNIKNNLLLKTFEYVEDVIDIHHKRLSQYTS